MAGRPRGDLDPLSHRETASGVTPTAPATSAWLRPASMRRARADPSRAARRTSASLITSPAVVLMEAIEHSSVGTVCSSCCQALNTHPCGHSADEVVWKL